MQELQWEQLDKIKAVCSSYSTVVPPLKKISTMPSTTCTMAKPSFYDQYY
jgi:hypothetical protein